MSSSFSSDRSGPASIGDVIHDENRLRALRRYDILDTAPEPAFDRIARLAAHLFDAPVALVNFVDRDRQWFKSTVGIDETETGLDTSFCVYTVGKGDVFVVEDLVEDERFGDNSYVTDHGVRFYAGAPLVTPADRRLGTVCVLDTEPRSPTEDTLDRLADLAGMVVDELELRRERVEHEQRRDLLRQAQELAHVGGWQYDPRDDTLTWTDQTYRIHDLPPDAEIDVETALNFYTGASRPVIREHLERLIEEGGSYDLELDIETAEGSHRRIRTIGRARRSDRQTTKVNGAIRDITASHRQEQALRESQKRWKRLVDKHPGPIHISVDGTYAYANEATAELLGVDTADDLIGRDMRVFLSPDEQSRLRDRAQTVYEEKSEADLIEARIKRPDGTERTVLVRSVPIQYGGKAAAQTMMWDVTEHRTAERELRRSEKQFRTIVENAQPMTFMVDRDGTILLSEGRDLQSLGLEPGETVGTSMYDQYKHYPEVIDAVHRALDGAYVDEKLTVNDRVFDAWYSPFYDEEGEVAGVIGMAADITEQAERKRELRASYEHLRLALRAADAGTFEYDIATDHVQWDERTRDLFGLHPDSRVHKGDLLEEIVLAHDWAHLNEAFERAAEEKERFEVSFRIHRSDDREVRHIRSYGIVLPNEAGTADRVVGINQDVTERRRRKEALERQNDLFTKAQDIASVGAWEYDLRTGEVTLSDEAYRIHGLAPDAGMTPGRSIEFYHPDDRSTIREAFTRAVEEGESYDLELRLIADDGTQRWVRTRGEPQREDEEIVRVRGTIQDITEQKETEQNLRRSREQLSMAVEGGNIGTWNWDTETDTVIFNRRWAEMLGYSREELDFHFSTWKELVYPEDLPRAMEQLEAYLAGEADTYAPELRMRTKSGDWKWIQTIGRVVERDEDGAVTRAAGIHLDIDERKRAEQALRDAKTRYQTLIEHFPDGGVFLFNEDLEYVLAGGKGLVGVGLSPDDFEGNTPHDLFPPEIAEEQTLHARRALEGEEHMFEQEYQGRHYRVQMLPVRTDLGEIPLGMSVSQDITEQKESREQLEQYRDYTDRLLNAVDDLFFAIDEEAQFQRWNARVPEVTGYSEEELEEVTAFDLVPKSERERVAARIADAFGTGNAKVEVSLLRKDGTTIPYEFVGSVVEHPEGDLHLVGVGRDIADRKERERLLRQAETFFRHAQDALFLIDVQRDRDEPTFAVRRVNPAYESKTGLSNEEVRGTPLQEILGTEAARRVETRYRRCVDRREPLEYEEQIPFDDTMRYWTTRIAPVVVDGEVRQIVGSTRDVTDRKRRREELKEAKDAAEEADRIKSALLSNMNHEFRTPLTSIISFSELLSREPDLAETFADRILGGGRRLLHTLNTVMDFAELEAGSVSPTPMRVDVNSLVRSTVDTFSHLIDQDLSVQIHEPAGPLTASLDEHHVERVLTHLIHNAIKFTEEGTIEITLRETPDGVEVSVSDPGIGIDPEILPRMFDEFAQASSGSDRTHEGNGIGLTIVRRLVARMDGDVTLHSTPGAGTEATVRLPNLE